MNKIISKNLFYRPLNIEDVTDEYVSWLNNKEINKYLEVRHIEHTSENVKDFICSRNQSKNEFLYGIFCKKNNKHIGNVKIGNINFNYKTGEISLFIGDKNYWGRKLGSEIIKTLTNHSFNFLGLYKIEAGCYESNKASLKSFLKCGYSIEGNLKNHIISEGNRESLIWLGMSQDEQIS